MADWISVKDKLPESGKDVLCYTSVGHEIGWYNNHLGWYEKNGAYSMRDVTHWMPLPEPPKGE